MLNKNEVDVDEFKTLLEKYCKLSNQKYCIKLLADVTKEIDLISTGINNNDELRGIEIAYDAFKKCLERSVNEGI